MALSVGGSAFDIGKEIGAARSPVNGLGQAIRNIMDTARKKGLLQAQSQFQTEGANLNAIAKEERANLRGEEEVNQLVIGPAGRTTNIPVKRGDPRPIAEPSQQLSRLQQIKLFADENKTQNVIENQIPTVPQGAARIFATSGTRRIVSSDGGTTWRDVATGELIQ